MDRYLGFSVRLPISGQGESGHWNPLSLPTQLWERKEYLVPTLSLPPSSRVLLIHCTPCLVVTTIHWEAIFMAFLWMIPLSTWHSLFPPPPRHSIALSLGQPRVEKRLVWYRMISLMWNVKTIQMNTHENKDKLRFRGFTGGLMIKDLPANAGGVGSILGQDDPLEEEMATHSSILAWRIPWAGEPGRLQSMGSQRIGHNLAATQTQSA